MAALLVIGSSGWFEISGLGLSAPRRQKAI